MKGQQYPVTQIRLRSRDRLLLYSDGLIEAENAAGESFEETLSQRMSGHRDRTAAATADALVAELRAFAGPEPQDDTTIVLVDLL